MYMIFAILAAAFTAVEYAYPASPMGVWAFLFAFITVVAFVVEFIRVGNERTDADVHKRKTERDMDKFYRSMRKEQKRHLEVTRVTAIMRERFNSNGDTYVKADQSN